VAPVGIGAYLAQQRRLRGLDLEDLVSLTRIPRRSLERLEGGAFDRHPDGFARGFVRSVARAMGLDPDDTVARMLEEPVASPRASWPDPRRLLLGVGGLLVLLGLALLLVLRPEGPADRDAPAAREPRLVRRDAVRALAVRRGLWPPESAPRASAAPQTAANADVPAR